METKLKKIQKMFQEMQETILSLTPEQKDKIWHFHGVNNNLFYYVAEGHKAVDELLDNLKKIR